MNKVWQVVHIDEGTNEVFPVGMFSSYYLVEACANRTPESMMGFDKYVEIWEHNVVRRIS